MLLPYSMAMLFTFLLLFQKNSDIVEMIKQFTDERVEYYAFSFHGDVVYVGINACVIQWNMVTDAVGRFGGYPSGLISQYLCPVASYRV